MTKILASALVVVALGAVVVNGTLALFTDTATVNGITLAAGNADLQISGDGVNFVDNWNLNQSLTGLYPGFSAEFEFWLKNNSSAAIVLDVTGKLTTAGGDWNAFKDVVTLTIVGVPGATGTLADWNAAPVLFATLAQGEQEEFTLEVSVDEDAGNELAGKSITNVTFQLVGTQVVTP